MHAFGLVARGDANIKLHVLGDGNGLPAARIKAQQLGLSELVEFHGRVDNPCALIGNFYF